MHVRQHMCVGEIMHAVYEAVFTPQDVGASLFARFNECGPQPLSGPLVGHRSEIPYAHAFQFLGGVTSQRSRGTVHREIVSVTIRNERSDGEPVEPTSERCQATFDTESQRTEMRLQF